MERKSTSYFNARKIAVIGMLSSISMVLGMTPLGFIPIPPANATIMHVPVVIGAILEGPAAGAMIGLIFGVFSVIRAITTPNILSFAFINPLVSVFPRILIGIFTYYAYKTIRIKKQSLRIGLAAIIGSFTNTIGVLGMIYLIYLEKYAASVNLSTAAARKGILSIALVNGIPEAIICAVLTVVIVLAVSKTRTKR
jgi:uncharacterized membrane protein